LDKRDELSISDIRNTYVTLEVTTVTPDIQTTYRIPDMHTERQQICGNYNNKEEGKIFEYTGKVSYL
jgi:hypothetical protein